MEFRLDLGSGVPPYLQLVQQVEHALHLGYLVPGDELPKVRDLVAKLAINPNTVSKAYPELETKGLVVGVRARGRSSRRRSNRWRWPSTAYSGALWSPGWRRPTRRGSTTTGWRRSSRACCGISVSAGGCCRPARRGARRGGGRGMNIIEARALGKSYGPTRALQDCALGDPRRACRRARRAERCGKVDAPEPCRRACHAEHRRGDRARRVSRRFSLSHSTGSRSWHRTPRCSKASPRPI